jgi:serine protease
VIVAAAGNSAGLSVGLPGNCSGVITVAGLRHIGTKVGFSSLGPEVTLAAPGGNCVNSTGACLYPILSTTNSGTQGPVVADNAYTNSTPSVGTSFSAPLVAGTAALLYSARPGITPDQVRAVLTKTSRPFISTAGATPSTPVCTAPSSAEQLECYCTTSTCGAGMLDANAAVRAVAPALTVSTSPGTPQATQALTLGLSSDGGSFKSYSWTLVDGAAVAGTLSGASTAAPTLTPVSAGNFTVKVDVVDDYGLSHSHTATVTVAAAPAPTPSTGGGGGGLMQPGWLLGLLAAVPLLRRQRRR